VNHLVNIIGGHSRLQCAAGDIQNFARKATHNAHALLLFLVQDLDGVAADKLLLRARDTIAGIIGMRNGLRDGASGGQWVYRT
jgi:hypothetical protein